jgi:hypothetical protein
MQEIGLEWEHVHQEVREKIRAAFPFKLTALGTDEQPEIPEPRIEGRPSSTDPPDGGT